MFTRGQLMRGQHSVDAVAHRGGGVTATSHEPFPSLPSDVSFHMGLSSGPSLKWFTAAWSKHTSAKLDLGQCCLRFRHVDEIPYDLLGELVGRMTPR
jgi:hypothetical protein